MFREPLLSPAQFSLEYVQAGLWDCIQCCIDITDGEKRQPNHWSLYSDSKNFQSSEEMKKARKVFPHLETLQKLLRTRSLICSVQLKYFVKSAFFSEEKKFQNNFKYFN